jgi:hypothetical protein
VDTHQRDIPSGWVAEGQRHMLLGLGEAVEGRQVGDGSLPVAEAQRDPHLVPDGRDRLLAGAAARAVFAGLHVYRSSTCECSNLNKFRDEGSKWFEFKQVELCWRHGGSAVAG